jgi:Nucleotidyl transferase of unknown function (DUF2204)
MEPSLKKLLAKLAEAEVLFVIVGGIAVTLQGYTRFTEDIDVLIDDERANIERLLAVLSDYGEGYAKELSVEDFTDSEGAIRLIEEVEMCQIDIFTRLAGVKYTEAVADADIFLLDQHQIHYASKARLIFWKKRSGREKDRLDANALELLRDDPKAFDL